MASLLRSISWGLRSGLVQNNGKHEDFTIVKKELENLFLLS